MATPKPDVFDDKVLSNLSERGLAIYNDRLKSALEPGQNGNTVAIHLDSGDYTVERSSSGSRRALRERQPNGAIVTMRIGPDQFDQLARRMMTGQSPVGHPK